MKIKRPKRQTILSDMVETKYNTYHHSKPSFDDFKSSIYWNEVQAVFLELGGKCKTLPIAFKGWDVPTTEFIIELDEEQHFNRYRLSTLKSPFYNNLKTFSVKDYLRYYEQYEKYCLRNFSDVGFWKSPKSEEFFEISNKPGDLSGMGSSRWKYRAFNDFLRDISSKIINVPVIRLSVYDSFEGQIINNLLLHRKESIILKLIEVKLHLA